MFRHLDKLKPEQILNAVNRVKLLNFTTSHTSVERLKRFLKIIIPAAVVRRIYQMTIEGMGPHEIAKALAADKVERPSYYMNRRGIVPYKYPMDTPYVWNGSTVSSIISKPEYTGATVNFRSYKASYKDTHTKKASKDDWVIFPGTHEAIVDTETWETAQRLRKTVKRTDSLGEANPLTGKLFCADCGARLYNYRKPYSWIN